MKNITIDRNTGKPVVRLFENVKQKSFDNLPPELNYSPSFNIEL